MTLTEAERQDAIKKLKVHHENVKTERNLYGQRINLAKTQPQKYLSIIMDGSDQNQFQLPKQDGFYKSKMFDEAEKYKVHFEGVFVHGHGCKVFTSFENVPNDVNTGIECLQRTLAWVEQDLKKKAEGTNTPYSGLPPTLFLQMDNAGSTNKNKFMFAYIADLIARQVFQKVVVSFLPVGHTHEDIDQIFSTISAHLRKKRAISLKQLHEYIEEARLRSGFRPSVEHIWHAAMVKQLISAREKDGHIQEIEGITRFRCFVFAKSSRRSEVEQELAPPSIASSITAPKRVPNPISSEVFLFTKATPWDELTGLGDSTGLCFLKKPLGISASSMTSFIPRVPKVSEVILKRRREDTSNPLPSKLIQFERSMTKLVGAGESLSAGFSGFISQTEKDTLMSMAQRIHCSTEVPFHWENEGLLIGCATSKSKEPNRSGPRLQQVPVSIVPTYKSLLVSGSKDNPVARLDNQSAMAPGDMLVFHRPEHEITTHPEPFWLAQCLPPGPYLTGDTYYTNARASAQRNPETYRDYLKQNALVDVEWYEYQLPCGGVNNEFNILEAEYRPIRDANKNKEVQFSSAAVLWFPALTQKKTIPKQVLEWIRRDCALSHHDFTLGSIRRRVTNKKK